MQLIRLIRASTKRTMFGVKCRHITPSASLQSSLPAEAGRGQSSDEQGSRKISGAGMLWQGLGPENLVSQRDSHAGVTQLGENVLL